MKYDNKEKIIFIDYKEFVTIARRGISPILPYDDEEPSVIEPTAKHIRKNIPCCSVKPLKYAFESEGQAFLLTANAELKNDSDILIIKKTDSDKPKSAELSQIRGEGFVLGYMLANELGIDNVNICYHFISNLTGNISKKQERVAKNKLRQFFDKCINAISKYAPPEIERVTERLPSMASARFPYPTVREGQSEFIRSAYRTLARGGKLYASAPTGTGKTVSAIFPAIRALGDRRVEKIFYFTPKTTTAAAVKDCIELLTETGVKIKAAILSSKESQCKRGLLCRTSRKLCQSSSSNRLSDAVIELYKTGTAVATAEGCAEIAEKHCVCPHELMLAYSELCDLIVCDFNYLFDPSVYIRRFFDRGGKYAFLVDEAHNLSERVREAYSATLTGDEIAEPSNTDLLGPLSKLKQTAISTAKIFNSILNTLVKEDLCEQPDGKIIGASHTNSPPERFYSLFEELVSVAEAELFLNYSAKDDEREARCAYLRAYLSKIKKFQSILSRFDSSYEFFAFYDGGKMSARLFCLDTGGIIKERLALGHSAVLFSGTLSPLHYYRAVLGGDRSDEILEVSSPFDKSQLSITIMDKISTRYSEREDTLGAVCRVIAATVSAKRGNYMIFSPSFAYSEALCKMFSSKYPKLRILSQRKNMSQREKKEFLLEFEKNDSSYLVAFCVMGGIYSEGIDLAGESLIGAVIVGIGLPSVSYEREAIAAYYEEKYEQGKQYAYIYPGINRVFQAAGRVIRRENDRGVIVLIDDRFDDPIYKKSLPSLYSEIKFLSDAKDLREELDEFWKNIEQ